MRSGEEDLEISHYDDGGTAEVMDCFMCFCYFPEHEKQNKFVFYFVL